MTSYCNANRDLVSHQDANSKIQIYLPRRRRYRALAASTLTFAAAFIRVVVYAYTNDEVIENKAENHLLN